VEHSEITLCGDGESFDVHSLAGHRCVERVGIPEDGRTRYVCHQFSGSAHEPGAGPPPLTVFDLAHAAILFALVNSLGFSVIVSSSAGSGWKVSAIR
jgi:hypothetical protein